MKKLIAPLAALTLCSLIWVGCASNTPKAEVPPPPEQPATAAAPSTTETQPWSDKDHVRSQSPVACAASAEETIARFKDAYPAAGSPTMVLFINQQPSGDMRTGLDPADQTSMWAVENGFLQPFLKAGATIKHGTTAVGPTEPEAQKTGESGQTTEASDVKPEPMHGGAELVIDLNVAPLPQSDSGYAIRATVRQAGSGVIVGHAAGSNLMAGREAVPTKLGYQFKEAGTKATPLDLVARGVAVDLMNSMMEKWGAASPHTIQPAEGLKPTQ